MANFSGSGWVCTKTSGNCWISWRLYSVLLHWRF